MGSERGELAAERVRAAARRAEQLRERIARLQAGVAPTRDDVERARAAAEAQRNESLRAQRRLLTTFAAAAGLRRRSTSILAPDDRPPRAAGDELSADPARERPPARVAAPRTAPDPGGDDDPTLERLRAENRLLRVSLVSIASVAGEGDDPSSRDRRRWLWQALVDQCGSPSWQGWAHALCRTAPSLLPGVRGAAISGYDDQGAPHLLAVTDEWTRQAEEVHQLVGEGPAVDAYETQQPVVVGRVSDEQGRWPGYVSAAASTGLSGLCALPIRLNGVSLGSITFYQSEETGPGPKSWSNGAFLAAVAAKLLLADLDAVEDGSYPWHDGDQQVQIAAGILSVQLDATVDEALALMRAFAFSNAHRLPEVADSIVDGSLRLS